MVRLPDEILRKNPSALTSGRSLAEASPSSSSRKLESNDFFATGPGEYFGNLPGASTVWVARVTVRISIRARVRVRVRNRVRIRVRLGSGLD